MLPQPRIQRSSLPWLKSCYASTFPRLIMVQRHTASVFCWRTSLQNSSLLVENCQHLHGFKLIMQKIPSYCAERNCHHLRAYFSELSQQNIFLSLLNSNTWLRNTFFCWRSGTQTLNWSYNHLPATPYKPWKVTDITPSLNEFIQKGWMEEQDSFVLPAQSFNQVFPWSN